MSLESHPSILKYPITNQLLTKPPPCKYSGGAGDVSRRRGRRARSRLSKENRDGPRGRQARGAQGGDRRAKGTPGVRAARRERGVAAARAGSNRAMHHASGLPNVSLLFIVSVWAIRMTSCFLNRMSEEILTRQTAAAPWDASRRQRRDPMSRALDDAAALSERNARDAASVLG